MATDGCLIASQLQLLKNLHPLPATMHTFSDPLWLGNFTTVSNARWLKVNTCISAYSHIAISGQKMTVLTGQKNTTYHSKSSYCCLILNIYWQQYTARILLWRRRGSNVTSVLKNTVYRDLKSSSLQKPIKYMCSRENQLKRLPIHHFS